MNALWVYTVALVVGRFVELWWGSRNLTSYDKKGRHWKRFRVWFLIRTIALAIPSAICAATIITWPYVADGLIALVLAFYIVRLIEDRAPGGWTKSQEFLPCLLVSINSTAVLIARHVAILNSWIIRLRDSVGTGSATRWLGRVGFGLFLILGGLFFLICAIILVSLLYARFSREGRKKRADKKWREGAGNLRVTELMTIVRNASNDNAERAAMHLRDLRSPQVVKPMIRLLHNRKMSVRYYAVLAVSGLNDARIKIPLASVVRNHENESRVRCAAAAALCKYVPISEIVESCDYAPADNLKLAYVLLNQENWEKSGNTTVVELVKTLAKRNSTGFEELVAHRDSDELEALVEFAVELLSTECLERLSKLEDTPAEDDGYWTSGGDYSSCWTRGVYFRRARELARRELARRNSSAQLRSRR